MTRILNWLVRAIATPLHRLKPRPDGSNGAHAIALTPERRVILVRLRYAAGWRLPGGGRSSGESVQDAVLRELREEIGMLGHGEIRAGAVPGVLIVENVTYRPRKWSWEVEAICEAAPDRLPPDVSPRTREWLKAARDRL